MRVAPLVNRQMVWNRVHLAASVSQFRGSKWRLVKALTLELNLELLSLMRLVPSGQVGTFQGNLRWRCNCPKQPCEEVAMAVFVVQTVKTSDDLNRATTLEGTVNMFFRAKNGR